jgi:hypothetical protein
MPPRARFEPRFSLSLMYVFACFFLYALLLAAPALLEVWRSVPAGPEQQAAAERAAREAVSGRLVFAFLAALVTVAGLAYWNALPGMRRR